MKYIIGTKKEMTQIFDKEGRCYPGTIISTSPCVITQVKTSDIDGYNSIQVGFGEKRDVLINNALKGHFKDIGNFRYLKEKRLTEEEVKDIKRGDKIDLSSFSIGDNVSITGISKGKGFQGVVKRWGFHGGPRSHGQKHSEREPGSIGATGPQRVFKGKKMAGRMGNDKVTVKNLKILKVDEKNNEIVIGGAVPGKRGTLLEVKG